MPGLERDLQEFEREEWGTNDWEEIKQKIYEKDKQERENALTGMEEEQREWEGLDDD